MGVDACSLLSGAEQRGDKRCCHHHSTTFGIGCLLAKLPAMVSGSVLIIPAPFLLIKEEVSFRLTPHYHKINSLLTTSCAV